MNYEGKVWDDPRGPECLGIGTLQRFYQANDGWFYLGARGDQLATLRGVKGLDHIDASVGADDPALEKLLEQAIMTDSVANWVTALQGVGIGAYGIVKIEDLMADPTVEKLGLAIVQDIEGIGEVVMPGITTRFSETPARVGKPTRKPGGDAREVLGEIGMGDQVDELDEAWVLRVPAGI